VSPHHSGVFDANSTEESVRDVVSGMVEAGDDRCELVHESAKRRGVDIDSAVAEPAPSGWNAADSDDDLAAVVYVDFDPNVSGCVANWIDRGDPGEFGSGGTVAAGHRDVVANHLGDAVESRMSAETAVARTVLSMSVGDRPRRAKYPIQHALCRVSFRGARAGVVDQRSQP